MSSKFTFYAWEKSPHTAHEKLVLLKLADIANHDGIVAFELKEIAKACLIEEYKLANLLTSIVNQGFLDKSHVEKRAGREVHVFKLLLTDTLDLKVMTPAEMTKTTPPVFSPMEHANAPNWTSRSFGLYNIPAASRDAIWQKFARENSTNTTNLYRLENQFEAWLDNTKQSGALDALLGVDKKQQSKASKAPKQPQSSGYLSTHDLDENKIPDWAEQTIVHAGLPIDANLFWEKFVVYYKSRANEYISITQLLNKLRYWIVNEKQSTENRRQAEERRKLSYQMNDTQGKNLSPSEQFREYLRSQGKKPNF